MRRTKKIATYPDRTGDLSSDPEAIGRRLQIDTKDVSPWCVFGNEEDGVGDLCYGNKALVRCYGRRANDL